MTFIGITRIIIQTYCVNFYPSLPRLLMPAGEKLHLKSKIWTTIFHLFSFQSYLLYCAYLDVNILVESAYYLASFSVICWWAKRKAIQMTVAINYEKRAGPIAIGEWTYINEDINHLYVKHENTNTYVSYCNCDS